MGSWVKMINCLLKFILVLKYVKGIWFWRLLDDIKSVRKIRNGYEVIFLFCFVNLIVWKLLYNDWRWYRLKTNNIVM